MEKISISASVQRLQMLFFLYFSLSFFFVSRTWSLLFHLLNSDSTNSKQTIIFIIEMAIFILPFFSYSNRRFFPRSICLICGIWFNFVAKSVILFGSVECLATIFILIWCEMKAVMMQHTTLFRLPQLHNQLVAGDLTDEHQIWTNVYQIGIDHASKA